MSAAGSSLAIVSLGVSCQTALQIRHNIASIPELYDAQLGHSVALELDESSFPFDWRIMSPASFTLMARDRLFFPVSPSELTNHAGRNGEALFPYWPKKECYFWHDFRVAEGEWDVHATFDDMTSKYAHTVGKFLRPTSKRLIFVIANTQNNLDKVSRRTGLNFYFDRRAIEDVRKSLDLLFPDRTIELIVVTTESRSASDRADWPARTYVIDQASMGPEDVYGDGGQWREIFVDYLSGCPAAR